MRRALLLMVSMLPLHAMVTSGSAQEPRSHELKPEARLATTFSSLTGLHELPDGRVVVLDMADHGLAIVDRGFTTVAPLSRQGSGPGEYVRATRLFSMPNGAAAVLDWGSTRLLDVDAAGKPGGTRPANSRCPTATARYPLFAAVDREARFYSEGRFDPAAADSTPIIRWKTSCAGDTLAFHRIRRPSGLELPPFFVTDQWAVSSDGRLALVHHDPYRVTMIGPDRARIVGPPVEYQRIRVTEDIKADWRIEQQRPMGVMTVTRAGAVSGGLAKKPFVEPERWPSTLPPFLRDATLFDADGFLWVRRTVARGERPRYDVFDPGGRVVAGVRLPAGSRIVGFGSGTVYTVLRDDDDLEFLERHRFRLAP
jgi:hypothetical protein